MPSSTTYSTLETNAKNVLKAGGAATVWATANLQRACALALEEYSAVKPLDAVGTLTFASATREIALASLTGLIDVKRVWFPYLAAEPLANPSWVGFELLSNKATLRLSDDADEPSVNDVARVFYTKLHTVNGLDSAGSTTIDAGDDHTIVLGLCAYACLERATDLNETSANMSISTPNYAALAEEFFTQFRARLGSVAPAAITVSVRGRN